MEFFGAEIILFEIWIWCEYVIIRCQNDINMIFKDSKIGADTLLIGAKMELFGAEIILFDIWIWCEYVIIRCQNNINMIFKDSKKIGVDTLLIGILSGIKTSKQLKSIIPHTTTSAFDFATFKLLSLLDMKKLLKLHSF